ncbi:MAG: DNA-binding transcriptional regulator [Kiritimatiellae bacterium]|nr:DNA-binding transcriptional regulator [Kiritimatiellia bacterium]
MVSQDKHVALVLSLNKRFDRKVIEGVTRFVHESGHWSVFLEDDPTAKIPDFRHGHFDGVIADLDDPRIPRQVAGLAMPVVGIGGIESGCALNLTVSTVGTNNHKIAQMAAEYLMRLGLRSFGYCGVPASTIDPWNRERQETFERQVTVAGHACAIFKARYKPSHSWEQLQEAIRAWLDPLPKPVGVLAANDVRARHVLEACRRFGFRVPDDVAVLGVDNDELICDLATPPLSSIVQGTEEIGYRAAKLLDALMRHQAKRVTNILVEPVTIAERASTDLIATTDRVVADALRLIRQQACGGLGVAQVAQGIGVSRSTLDGHFRQVVGRSVHQEILRVQISAARSLLAATDMPLEDIARRAGFCHAQYLAAIFRRECSQTPGEFRRRAR